jgi:hypothetical protein
MSFKTTFESSSPVVIEATATELPFIAGSGGVTAGQLVYISSTGTVLPTSSAVNFVGVVKVGAAAGKLCSVMVAGAAKIRVTVSSSAAVSAGDMVVSAAAGTIVTSVSPTTRYLKVDTGASSGGKAIVIL